MLDLLLLCFIIMMFARARKLRKDETYRNSVINHRSNEINEKGELYTGFRRYKSVEGYIKYQYVGLIAWGIFAVIYTIILRLEYKLNFYIRFKVIIFLVAMIIIDFILYRKNKNI